MPMVNEEFAVTISFTPCTKQIRFHFLEWIEEEIEQRNLLQYIDLIKMELKYLVSISNYLKTISTNGVNIQASLELLKWKVQDMSCSIGNAFAMREGNKWDEINKNKTESKKLSQIMSTPRTNKICFYVNS